MKAEKDMTASELRAALDKLELGQAALADHIGVHRESVSRWCSGETPVPGPVAVAVNLMLGSVELSNRVPKGKRRVSAA